jgi:hypothetical protein
VKNASFLSRLGHAFAGMAIVWRREELSHAGGARARRGDGGAAAGLDMGRL